MKTAEQNYRLLQEIEANRRFLLTVYEQNPKLLESAELRIQQLFATTEQVEQEEKRGMSAAKQRGTSLIELIMFIVIVSVALAGILLVMNVTTRNSADPLVRKQALAIAESLLEEIELQDYSNPAGGFTPAPPGNPAQRASFDDVDDYNGFATTADNVMGVPGLGNYNVSVAVTSSALGAATAKLITVTVDNPLGQTIEATGYRAAY